MACVTPSTPAMGDSVLSVADLNVAFETPEGAVTAVTDFSLEVSEGECVGIVGESGAGKSQAVLAVMGLLAGTARVSGHATFQGAELIGAAPRVLNRVRGSQLTMIFQDPLSSLTPHMRIGEQIGETLRRHRGYSRAEARRRALELLEQVHVNDAARRLDEYPHQLSGGMRQRTMIALALACDPALLIADEPTTALDVTIQAQILALLAALKRARGMSMVLITHDFGVVAGLADRVAVMYAGRIVECGPIRPILRSPAHPYTRALLRSMPRLDAPSPGRMEAIRGAPPNARALPAGCAFHPRCDRSGALCRHERPVTVTRDVVQVACHFPIT
jgi:oligopeptide transport system ATP-binding protein